jgi:hypothetical protein
VGEGAAGEPAGFVGVGLDGFAGFVVTLGSGFVVTGVPASSDLDSVFFVAALRSAAASFSPT